MTTIKKVIFPVGGLGTRFLPATKAIPKEMLTVIDKPLIQYAFEEARAAGIEEFIFVTSKGKGAIEDHFDTAPELEDFLKERSKFVELKMLESLIPSHWKVSYTRQQKALGLGHAVWSARHLVGNEPFAVMLPDDLIFGNEACLAEMVEAYNTKPGNYIAVMEVPQDQTRRYGIIRHARDHQSNRIVSIEGMIEKPSHNPPSNMAIVGRYLLQPEIFSILEHLKPGAGEEIQLTDALVELLEEQAFFGLRFSGTRFDCGSKEGLLKANIHVALRRPELADEILAELKEIVNSAPTDLKECA